MSKRKLTNRLRITNGISFVIILILLIKIVDLSDKKYSGRQAADLLEENGITVNKNGIPNDPRSFVETSGIRIGTAAETTRGHGADWFRDLTKRIISVLL